MAKNTVLHDNCSSIYVYNQYDYNNSGQLQLQQLLVVQLLLLTDQRSEY